jgi:hypothetical protein
MLSCHACDGFLPDGLAACPNCGVEPRKRSNAVRRVAQAAAGAAVMMTLMACYGGPAGPMLPDCKPTKLTGNGSAQATTAECNPPGAVTPNCVSGSSPFGVIHYQPSQNDFGKAGKLDISWGVIANVVPDPGLGMYVVEGGEPYRNIGVCVAPTGTTSASFDVTKNEGYDIVIAGAHAHTFSKFQVTVAFTPNFTPQ